MASSTQKKTTTKKSGSRSGSRTAKGKQPQKRPIRREVWGRDTAGAGAVCAGELLRRAGDPHRPAGQAPEGTVRLRLLAGRPCHAAGRRDPAAAPGPPGHPAGHLRPAAAAAGRSAVPHHFRRGRLCAERLGRFEESLDGGPCPEGGRRCWRSPRWCLSSSSACCWRFCCWRPCM